MSDGHKDKKQRSPAYPFIPLEGAIARARAFWARENRHAAPIAVAASHWDYGAKSSGAMQTVSALKQFGLLEEEGGGGAERKVKITELARQIILDEEPNSERRRGAIKIAALSPALYSALWEKWGAELPSDGSFRTALQLEMGFNASAVPAVITNYKDTLAYAKLGSSDKISDAKAGSEHQSKIVLGDFVQWESSGILQFPEPLRVVRISDDANFVFVEGSQTGLPMQEVTKSDAPIQSALGGAVGGGVSIDHGKALGAVIPPMNWVLSVPRGVRAQLIITGNVKADDLRRLKAQIDFLAESFADEQVE